MIDNCTFAVITFSDLNRIIKNKTKKIKPNVIKNNVKKYNINTKVSMPLTPIRGINMKFKPKPIATDMYKLAKRRFIFFLSLLRIIIAKIKKMAKTIP